MKLLVVRIGMILLCLLLGNPAFSQLSGMARRAEVTYSGKEIFKFHFTSSTKCADLLWVDFVNIGENRLLPTEHFSQQLGGTDDDDGWLVIKNDLGGRPLDGKIELRGDGTGNTWVEEIRVRKNSKPDIAGRTAWTLDMKSLNRVNKKRFVGRSIVASLTEPQATGISTDGQLAYPEKSKTPTKPKKRKFIVSLFKSGLPVLQGTLESEIANPDQLWKFCVDEVLKKDVKFHKTENASELLSLQEDGRRDADEMIFERSEGNRLAFHIEGLGISFLTRFVVNQKKTAEGSYWEISSAQWLSGKYKWAIRRNLVPELATPLD